jgi:hypothetical protein
MDSFLFSSCFLHLTFYYLFFHSSSPTFLDSFFISLDFFIPCFSPLFLNFFPFLLAFYTVTNNSRQFRQTFVSKKRRLRLTDLGTWCPWKCFRKQSSQQSSHELCIMSSDYFTRCVNITLKNRKLNCASICTNTHVFCISSDLCDCRMHPVSKT